MAIADGAYQQVEEFLITLHTRSGPLRLKLNHSELFALKDVVDKLTVISEESKLWPFGELEKRKGYLPALRTIPGSDEAGSKQ